MNQNLATLKEAFVTSKHFYDDLNFPRGFSRSGHFTLQESDVLENHGALLKSLYTKASQPQNEFQRQFVDVMEGRQTPGNVMEKTWTKYLKLTTCKTKFHTLFGRSKVETNKEEVEAVAVEADDEM
ncbi:MULTISPECIES: DUF413 domain-containing protein [Pseudoalteromonas]|uniref:Macrodomain Ori protein n=1 Tax=Pseudoalteromonas rubra TaxID=43658 RepID=A0A0U3GJ70_9GAMM|nr:MULTISPECIES: DUF413 domain-containing protein [Pseudoalteromonas]ALU43099.1 hypothetical protein AT705_09185 [Pseudoalteromonas rubra]MCG7562707.1 DUF413 domain-containing protein [Pseudoalteromonas sp. McH1-42]